MTTVFMEWMNDGNLMKVIECFVENREMSITRGLLKQETNLSMDTICNCLLKLIQYKVIIERTDRIYIANLKSKPFKAFSKLFDALVFD